VHLPHVTGMVTDLDAHLTQRTLTSLSAELTRREKILAAAGVKDLEEYTERASRQPRSPVLPRLVIVIDEFASLVRDLPDFVTGLVNIAQRGRSLGIITRSGGRPLALVLAGDPDILASGFGGWQADARRARRGCLTAPQTLPEGDLIGARLTHTHLGHPPRPGRALLNPGDGTLLAITVPIGSTPVER
jgi:hypothetical protein